MRELQLASYDYFLPKVQIATHPIFPKEAAKLLVYERAQDKITHATFKDFSKFLPPDTLLVFNNTKVLPARLYGTKVIQDSKAQTQTSGAKIEALFHKEISPNVYLMQFKGRLKVGHLVSFGQGIFARILKSQQIESQNPDTQGVGFKEAEFFRVSQPQTKSSQSFPQDSLESPLSRKEFFEFLEHFGHIPLPPYLKRKDTQEDKNDYQSVFAKHLGAIAAPTASLHFSEESYHDLKNRFDSTEITLHVGAGTFIGVNAENILEHKMHKEQFFLTQDSANKIQNASHITAIGTTAVRVIEEFARNGALSGECDLFLHPQNKPLKTQAILTNFHLPKTTLLMLVASFIGLDKTKQLYEEAIAQNYRFYSYGDGMLIL
ncbi:tRNA preQ1(34) S-adenosylmethionine ribosyltransferase-isomerase QueA [Helicobacter sp. MIT 05-5294]|uniref:tRNA preQ1(34) S-adenosylmethionine ribosyltransferase-isomerase QueA n=1 Tax=Helicobacter sp. MIT 05-5294 TaxID=1548150 RepID=UPI00051FD205|nr:tRNA preQ1(34) S-adenosylmethionine ribosyltransferase-isomerase QueA [Helicobacter sp. MIT 05-5294]TLD87852.1 tRNA preQ1(34) S-adenosylmethionine ribosyltransferase-isomerase QueA [Helicobacter sp. MIT 05-5294]